MKLDRKVKNALQVYLQWPLVFAVIVICANIAVTLTDKNAGTVMGIFTVLYLICAGWMFWTARKKVLNGLISFGADYSWSQKQLLASMELPYGIADTDGKLLWMNRAMTAVFRDEKSSKRSLTALFK